jgi:integrase/recombinase XerD
MSVRKRPSAFSNSSRFQSVTRIRGSPIITPSKFLAWSQRCGFQSLEDIEPITVAAYIEQHPGSPATIKQHMAGIRMFFSWLTEKGVLPINPAREVKTPKFSRTEGKTPAFSAEQVRALLDSIDTSHLIGHRDKALLATLAYTCFSDWRGG